MGGDGDLVEEVGIPEGVRDVVGRRLSRLPDEANATLRTAAVVGREFPVDVVAEVAGASEDVALEHIELAIGARLVDEVSDVPGRMTFSHALVRTTLVEELSTTRRVRLHRNIGEALEGAAGRRRPSSHTTTPRPQRRASPTRHSSTRCVPPTSRYGSHTTRWCGSTTLRSRRTTRAVPTTAPRPCSSSSVAMPNTKQVARKRVVPTRWRAQASRAQWVTRRSSAVPALRTKDSSAIGLRRTTPSRSS